MTTSLVTTRVLVAGIGNVFFRDDGFGPAVAAALLAVPTSIPAADGVRVVDYGIRGMHLAYDLLAEVGALVLIDTVPGPVPGSLSILEIGPDDLGEAEFDAHGMAPAQVLASLGSLGGTLPPTYLVGCVPADVTEGLGLTEGIQAAVEAAVELTRGLVADILAGRRRGPGVAIGATGGRC